MYFVRHRLLLIAVLLLLCLGICACGGSPATTTPGSNHTQLTTLKVCQLNKSINFFAVYVAQQKGYFTAQGLNIPTPPLLQVGPKLVSALESGQYDLANGVITDAFTWARVSSEARIIGA